MFVKPVLMFVSSKLSCEHLKFNTFHTNSSFIVFFSSVNDISSFPVAQAKILEVSDRRVPADWGQESQARLGLRHGTPLASRDVPGERGRLSNCLWNLGFFSEHVTLLHVVEDPQQVDSLQMWLQTHFHCLLLVPSPDGSLGLGTEVALGRREEKFTSRGCDALQMKIN